ncbi:MAG TPA: alpha-hydroxy-acid oxidizing enzyme [Oceanospirillaceae bacterium]|nr:alpha-hydroxy-acid oxidizing enzyme [Oceanospirillaceae bacterium]
MQNLIYLSACVADLKHRARQRIPRFAFDYIEEGCNAGDALVNNRQSLSQVALRPDYLSAYHQPTLTTRLMGQRYAAPLGIAPLGLSGLIWPDASAMHARAAKVANIPFVLSTVSTMSIEEAGDYAQDNFWFQLYPPSDDAMLRDLLHRAKQAGCQNLVVTVDVPSSSRRIKAIKSGLSVPPRITAANVLQAALRPAWSWATVKHGLPQFANMRPYMTGDLSSMDSAAEFMRLHFRRVVDADLVQQIRKQWQGNLIIKGICHLADAQQAVALGADGIIVSNHGGRQLDAGLSPVQTLAEISHQLAQKTCVMADSGVESGVDVGRYLALGAEAVFAGRPFLYGVAAHGEAGATHTIDLLLAELEQLMSQLHCSDPLRMHEHFIGKHELAKLG